MLQDADPTIGEKGIAMLPGYLIEEFEKRNAEDDLFEELTGEHPLISPGEYRQQAPEMDHPKERGVTILDFTI